MTTTDVSRRCFVPGWALRALGEDPPEEGDGVSPCRPGAGWLGVGVFQGRTHMCCRVDGEAAQQGPDSRTRHLHGPRSPRPESSRGRAHLGLQTGDRPGQLLSSLCLGELRPGREEPLTALMGWPLSQPRAGRSPEGRGDAAEALDSGASAAGTLLEMAPTEGHQVLSSTPPSVRLSLSAPI